MSVPIGRIYYTTNGVDPRLPGGAVAPEATVFSGPITLTGSARVLARTFYTNTWSALNDMSFPATLQPPRLDLVRNGSALTLSWPPGLIGYQLESATEIPSTAWQPVPAATNTITLPVNGSAAFYRLRKI